MKNVKLYHVPKSLGCQGGGGYSEFQMTGLIEGFGLEFSIPGLLGVEKFGKYFFGVA